MSTPTVDKGVAADLASRLRMLRQARDDGDPNHNPNNCPGCNICARERHLNRLLDRLPRGEP